MYESYELNVQFTLKAPIISSGGGDVSRGLNRVFYRNAEGKLALQGSHVKGKLREAMRELIDINAIKDVNLDELFGKENTDGYYLPERGGLQFTDFLLDNQDEKQSKESLIRVSINTQTGTSKENFLQVLEKIVQPGSRTIWKGKIRLFAPDKNVAQSLADMLILGLKWMTALGGAKGSGYGSLKQVSASLELYKPSIIPKPVSPLNRDLGLFFQFDDELFIGGVTKKISYAESQQVISGAVIKGSLARFLNQVCGTNSLTTPINGNNRSVYQQFPSLAECFSDLHFSHAFPALPNALERPVPVPYSIIKVSDGFEDVARKNEPILDEKEKAPSFQIDWKEKDHGYMQRSFGWAECEILNKTRTAIDMQTRRAKEDKLYTFQYLTPYTYTSRSTSTNINTNKKRDKVRWVSNLHFPQLDVTKQQQITNEFYQIVKLGWCSLGKRDARFTLDVGQGRPSAKIESSPDLIKDGLTIISLKTDALLFDGLTVALKRDNINLSDIYNGYWRYVTNQSCELVRFFARQKLMGGYLAKRYRLGSKTSKYYPFVLTEAGSVFVLKANDPTVASKYLQKLKEDGLPLPHDVLERVPTDKEPWEVCPFVPENGYGEININLTCHWDENFFTNFKGGHQ